MGRTDKPIEQRLAPAKGKKIEGPLKKKKKSAMDVLKQSGRGETVKIARNKGVVIRERVPGETGDDSESEEEEEETVVPSRKRRRTAPQRKMAPGEHEQVVKKFYCNMGLSEDRTKAVAYKEGRQSFVITPNSISMYLGYTRPSFGEITWPKRNRSIPLPDLLSALTDRPQAFKDGRILAGNLRETPRNLLKLLHYNLNPHGNEGRLKEKDLEFSYIFMREEEKVDWAEWIYDVIVEFCNKGGASYSNMPFPAIITKMFEDAKLKLEAGDDLGVHGCEQAITLSSAKKSKT